MKEPFVCQQKRKRVSEFGKTSVEWVKFSPTSAQNVFIYFFNGCLGSIRFTKNRV